MAPRRRVKTARRTWQGRCVVVALMAALPLFACGRPDNMAGNEPIRPEPQTYSEFPCDIDVAGTPLADCAMWEPSGTTTPPNRAEMERQQALEGEAKWIVGTPPQRRG